MPSGTFEKEILIKRKMADGKELIIYRAGPFFDVELNGIRMGKVRKLTTELTPEGISQVIKVGNYRLTLSPDEIEILQAVIDEREERRSMSYEERLRERKTVKEKIASEELTEFKRRMYCGPHWQRFEELDAQWGANEAKFDDPEYRKAQIQAGNELMWKWIHGELNAPTVPY